MNRWERSVYKRQRPPRPVPFVHAVVPRPAAPPVVLNLLRCPLGGGHTRVDGVELLGCGACGQAEADRVQEQLRQGRVLLG